MSLYKITDEFDHPSESGELIRILKYIYFDSDVGVAINVNHGGWHYSFYTENSNERGIQRTAESTGNWKVEPLKSLLVKSICLCEQP